jgi:retron-type reverse transcriptase
MSINISNAFDGISWTKIINNLLKSAINGSVIMTAQSLLVNTKIMLDNNTYKSNRGCPQGDKASPTLWNVAMNDLLIELQKIPTPKVQHLRMIWRYWSVE